MRAPSAPGAGQVVPDHNRACFGCGPEQAAGLGLVITAGEGMTMHSVFEVSDRMQGAPGLAHGGILSVAMDEICGSVNWLLAMPAVTARLACDYRKPVPVGRTLYLSAALLGVEGRKIRTVGEGRLDAPDGPIAVSAEALFIRVEPSHFTEARS